MSHRNKGKKSKQHFHNLKAKRKTKANGKLKALVKAKKLKVLSKLKSEETVDKRTLKSYEDSIKRNLKVKQQAKQQAKQLAKQQIKHNWDKKLQKTDSPIPVKSYEEAADYMWDKYGDCEFYDVNEYETNNRKICKIILDNLTGIFHTVYFDITDLIRTVDRLDTIETGITGFKGYKQTGNHFFDIL